MLTVTYTPPAPETPTACPCLRCHEYGPYCATACLRYDAWVLAGRPGSTALLTTEEDKP